MKTLKFLAVCSSLALATLSHALSWTDTDVILQNLNGSNSSYSGSFSLLSDGYDPATMTVSSAILSFGFVDDTLGLFRDADEFINIDLDDASWRSGVEVSGGLFSGIDWVSGSLSGSFLTSLQDGLLSYTISLNDTAGLNDTWLVGAQLLAWGERNQNGGGGGERVPDHGTTLGLIGLGLCALAMFRKRIA